MDKNQELQELRDFKDNIESFLRGCPLGYCKDKLITCRTTTEIDVITWLKTMHTLIKN